MFLYSNLTVIIYMYKWSNILKILANFLVGICVSFLSVSSFGESELESLKGQGDLIDMLQRITPLDEYRVNYPIRVRLFYDSGEFECEYQNLENICRVKRLIFLLSEHEVSDYSKAFYSSSAYEWKILSSSYSNGIVKIIAKKRLFSVELNDWYFEDVEFLFDTSSGNLIDRQH